MTVLSASETPFISSEDGVLTFSTGSCDAPIPEEIQDTGDEVDGEPEAIDIVESSEDDPTTVSKNNEDSEKSLSSSAPTTTRLNMAMLSTGLLSSFMAPRPYRGLGVLATTVALLGSLTAVRGEGHEAAHCKPSLELEISLPMGAEVTSKFGDTDHYLAATVDTDRKSVV